MKNLLSTFSLLLISLLINAQLSTDFKIKGQVTDNSNSGIPFANILMYTQSDSVFIKGFTADEKGRFEIRTPVGRYYLKISFLSFRSETVPDVNITNKDLELGNITLTEKDNMMNEVVITGEKSQLQLALDKKIFNIGSDITSMGGSAADILNKVPSVAVEMDGTVTLRGSQNVRILVDGKPSGLTGLRSTDALRQLQGDIIDKVEVITNPSAKFDASGEVGIINLVLKKNNQKGLNGTFSANAGYPSLIEGSYSINYRKDKFNFFSNYGITNRSERGKGNTFQKYTGPDTSFLFYEYQRNQRKSFSQNITLGADYFFSEKSILTGSLIYEHSNDKSTTGFEYIDYNTDNSLLQSFRRNEVEKANENNIEAALSYKKKYERKGQEFSVDFKWMQNTEPEKSDISQNNSSGENVFNEKGGTGENEYNYLLQTDYVQPYLEKGKIETGIKSNLRLVNSDYFLERQNENGEWTVFPAYTNNLEYTEKISAAYFMTNYEIKSFGFQAGLRAEYSDITTKLTKTGERNHRSYLGFFPSADFSYKMNDRNTFQLSYSRRLNRPMFRDLMPYDGFGDSRILRQGNPDLNPEYTDSYEAGYLFDNESFNFMSTLYYRYRTGVIQNFSEVDQSGITHVKPINLAVQNAFGIEGNFDLELNKFARFNSNFNFYKSVSKGSYELKDFSSKTFSWTNRSSLSLKILGCDFQSTLNYRAPRNNPQGRELASWYTDAGIRRDVFKGKGTIAFNVRDLFNSRKRISIIDNDGLYSRSENQFRMRQFLVSLSFRLRNINEGEEGKHEIDEGGEEREDY
jgi:outer membrane receptor protein involved in Fe transport